MDNPEKTSLSEAAEIFELRKSAGFGILGRKRPNRSEDWGAMQIANQYMVGLSSRERHCFGLFTIWILNAPTQCLKCQI